ncbi:GTP cyclohydrolase I FolE [Sulfolobales archaeon HS-7]|nr:GTP cyclohydrolase I FolE [Sulfolobales archaeon HS-7]
METTLHQELLVTEISKRVREILELLGEDVNREGLKETPERVAKALLEMTKGLREEEPQIKIFSLKSDGSPTEDNQVVIGKDIRFTSLCEHHLLPFIGHISIAYVVGKEGKVLGFSKLSRVANYFASRPQIQERLVQQIADALMDSELKPEGVIVIAEAIHMCVYVRGVKDPEASLTTIASRGILKTNDNMRRQVLDMINTSKRNKPLL